MTPEAYQELCKKAADQPETFWGEVAERLAWFKKWDKVKNTSFRKPVSVKWYEGGELNASFNCLDRHLEKRGSKTALIFEPDQPNAPSRKITYRELHEEVCRFANVLKKHGVKKGDCVTLYMPMIPETVVAMLACARIGAVHSAVFGGFAPDSIADRILNCESTFVVVAAKPSLSRKTSTRLSRRRRR